MSEDWIELLKFAITALIAVSGWLVGHFLSDRRDRSNKRRELILKHLINAYTILTNDISHRTSSRERQEKLEQIVTEIQLFGSVEQVKLAKRLANEVAQGDNFELDPLINCLRTSLRVELELESIPGNVTWLRFKN